MTSGDRTNDIILMVGALWRIESGALGAVQLLVFDPAAIQLPAFDVGA